MYQYQSLTDTIAAIATAQGVGGIGIIRVSGNEAISCVDKIFKAKNGKSLAQIKANTVVYGWIVKRSPEKDIIDEVLITIMKSPKSYTTEDIVEINCHGGIAALRLILDMVLAQGVRLANPGEFTKRAFLNGRIDLSQAEAVLDVINAKTQAFLRVSTHQLKGELSQELQSIREALMSIYTMIEAIINFPEDDISPQNRQQILNRIEEQLKRVERLLASSENGQLLKNGIRIVLAGKPNVGKSSLLNVLLKQQRAIVTDIAGTTRDVLEESMQINGVPLQLVDTAGILEPRDLVEEEAIKRSHLYINSADLVLLMIDSSRPLDQADQILFDQLKDRNVLVVLNKSDLPSIIDVNAIPFNKKVIISAQAKTAIEQLENAIIDLVTHGHGVDPNVLMVSNIRHIQSLKQANAYLTDALRIVYENGVWEIVSDNIKFAVNHLDAITGRNIDEDLIDQIFSAFCIGK